MPAGVVIDRCGFAIAIAGARPVGIDFDFADADYLLPLSEYLAFLSDLFARKRSSSQNADIFGLLHGIAGKSQLPGLTLTSSANVRMPEALYGISTSLLFPSLPEAIDGVRAQQSGLSGLDARFLVAAALNGSRVLACGVGHDPRVLRMLGDLRVHVDLLTHDCQIRTREEGFGP